MDETQIKSVEYQPGDRVQWYHPPLCMGTVLKQNGGLVKVQWDTGEVRRDEPAKLLPMSMPNETDETVERVAFTPGALRINLVLSRCIVRDAGGVIARTEAGYCCDTATAEANAERIVLCWNTHDDLVEALQIARKHIALIGKQTDADTWAMLEKADKALASATRPLTPKE